MNTNSQFQLPDYHPTCTTAFVTIMVLISQESYSFNLLSRLYYYRNLQNDQYLQKHQSIYNSVI